MTASFRFPGDWHEVLAALRVSGMARELAQHCEWRDLSGERKREQRRSEHESLFHAVRIAFGQLIDESAKPKVGDLLGNAFLREIAGHSVHLGNKLQKLTPRQLVIEVGFVGDITRSKTSFATLRDDVEARDLDRPRSWLEQTYHHLDRRRFTRTVVAQARKQFAPFDLDIKGFLKPKDDIQKVNRLGIEIALQGGCGCDFVVVDP